MALRFFSMEWQGLVFKLGTGCVGCFVPAKIVRLYDSPIFQANLQRSCEVCRSIRGPIRLNRKHTYVFLVVTKYVVSH